MPSWITRSSRAAGQFNYSTLRLRKCDCCHSDLVYVFISYVNIVLELPVMQLRLATVQRTKPTIMELVPLVIIWHHLRVSALSISIQWETIKFERLQHCGLTYKRELNKQVHILWFTWSLEYGKKWDQIVKTQCKPWNSTIVLAVYWLRGVPYHIPGLILACYLRTPRSACCSSPSPWPPTITLR